MCSVHNSLLRVGTLRQKSERTSVPAQQNLRCSVPQCYIPSFHCCSFHLLALMACIHIHWFTNGDFCSSYGGLSGVIYSSRQQRQRDILQCDAHYIYSMSWGECARLRENVSYVKVHRCNPKHLYPKLNGYGDNGERSLKV